MNRIIDYKHLSKKIQEWITSYSLENEISTLVIGVSGGVDSMVVSTLCAETGMPTIVVAMPINSSPEEIKLTDLQISLLDVKYENVQPCNIDLSDVFESFKSHDAFKLEFTSKLGLMDTKDRLRMTSLYQISSSVNGIVVGSGNKGLNFGIGNYSKYGHNGVDIFPISNLYKSEVIELGKILEIPQVIIDSEIVNNENTEIGLSYNELEWAMEYGMSKWSEGLELTDKEKDVIATYLNFNTNNKDKMVSTPIFDLKENNII